MTDTRKSELESHYGNIGWYGREPLPPITEPEPLVVAEIRGFTGGQISKALMVLAFSEGITADKYSFTLGEVSL